jgi:AcrR family transcriptional regulator
MCAWKKRAMNLRAEERNGKRNAHTPSSVPNGTPRRKRDRVAKQEALIRAATKLFASRGYDATRTREIAAHAGCAEGLIHRYFNGKAGLLLALLKFHAARETDDLSTTLPARRTLEEEIRQIMDSEVDRTWKYRDIFRVSVPSAILDAKIGKFVGRVGPERRAKVITERLRRHKQCRRIDAEQLKALSHALGALGFIFGFMRPVVLRYNRTSAKELAANLARIFTRGLVQQASL